MADSVGGLQKTQCAVGAAVNAASQCLVKSGGKLIVIATNLCQSGIGSLQARDDVALYHSEKEKTLFVPQSDYYQKCVLVRERIKE